VSNCAATSPLTCPFTAAPGNPLAIQPEIGPTVQSLMWTKQGWGYWDLSQAVPPVDAYKWLETRHSTAM
jgi:hypothetical protein